MPKHGARAREIKMNEQLTIFDVQKVVGDTRSLSPTNQLGDTKRQAIERFLSKSKTKDIDPAIYIKEYSPNGRKTKYFRLDYRLGKRVKSVHIPGGNVHAKLAQYRARELQAMIDRGAELGEIIAAVQTYRS
ncbi:MAG: hypothetical protein AAF383_19785 [Cyanobacteria bacterium P01_A01_bin.83]